MSAANGARRYPIPVFGGKAVAIEGEFPLSPEDWDQFMATLAAMKPGLVERPPVTADPGEAP